jgi:hypothetical protein
MALQCKECGTFARGNGIPMKCSGCGQTDPARYQRVDDPPMTPQQQHQHEKDKTFLEARSLPAYKHAKDNDDEILHKMFAGHTSIEILQEIAARMADDEDQQETVNAAKEIGLILAFDPKWRGP